MLTRKNMIIGQNIYPKVWCLRRNNQEGHTGFACDWGCDVFIVGQRCVQNRPNCVSHGTIKWHGHSKAIKKKTAICAAAAKWTQARVFYYTNVFVLKTLVLFQNQPNRALGESGTQTTHFPTYFGFVNPIRKHIILLRSLFDFQYKQNDVQRPSFIAVVVVNGKMTSSLTNPVWLAPIPNLQAKLFSSISQPKVYFTELAIKRAAHSFNTTQPTHGERERVTCSMFIQQKYCPLIIQSSPYYVQFRERE